tara:strand:+ start:133 stop:300 length:168 start_codon:yes stop_codon:yes gene_type:complete
MKIPVSMDGQIISLPVPEAVPGDFGAARYVADEGGSHAASSGRDEVPELAAFFTL